jgi:glycine dehydrogenase subunit 1
MGSYVPNSPATQQEMLRVIGAGSIDELYAGVPRKMLVRKLALPSGKSELEVRASLTALAERNRVFPTCLRGAGAYRHFIPAAVKLHRLPGGAAHRLHALSGGDQPGYPAVHL